MLILAAAHAIRCIVETSSLRNEYSAVPVVRNENDRISGEGAQMTLGSRNLLEWPQQDWASNGARFAKRLQRLIASAPIIERARRTAIASAK